MARHDVNIVVKARDEASKKFGKIGREAGGMGAMIKKAAAAAAVYIGGRQLLRFAGESLTLFGRQEQAVNGLANAYKLLGIAGRGPVKDMQDFAAELQKTTRYGDELTLELATMGATMGKLSGEELKGAVKAAMGLAKAYQIDVVAAMRLVARARMGDTTTLARYGIKLKEGLSAQGKFNEVMKIGARNFALVTDEVGDYNVAIEQMKNRLGDIKEKIGGALVPTILKLTERIKQLNMEHVRSLFNFGKWTVSIGAAVLLAPKIVAGIMGIAGAFKALAAGQTIVLGLSGPAGWAAIAVGTAIAAASVVTLERAFAGFNKTADESLGKVEDIKAGFEALGSSATVTIEGVSALNKAIGRKDFSAWDAEVKAVAEEPAWRKIQQRLIDLKQSIKDFGKSENQLLIRDMLEAGYSQQSIDFAQANMGRKSYLEKTKKVTDALKEAATDLRRQVATYGKTAMESMLYDLKQIGASAAQLAPIAALGRKLQEMQQKSAAGAARPALAFQESRFLTDRPGRAYDYQRQTATNTEKQLNFLRSMDGTMKEVADRLDDRGLRNGQNLLQTNLVP